MSLCSSLCVYLDMCVNLDKGYTDGHYTILAAFLYTSNLS